MSEFEKVTTGLGEECGVFGAYDMDGGDGYIWREKSTFQERPWTGK